MVNSKCGQPWWDRLEQDCLLHSYWQLGIKMKGETEPSTPRSEIPFHFIVFGPKMRLEHYTLVGLHPLKPAMCFLSSKQWLWMRLCLTEIKEAEFKTFSGQFRPNRIAKLLTIVGGILCVYENRYAILAIVCGMYHFSPLSSCIIGASTLSSASSWSHAGSRALAPTRRSSGRGLIVCSSCLVDLSEQLKERPIIRI